MRRIATILAVIMLAGSSLGFMKLIGRRRAAAVSGTPQDLSTNPAAFKMTWAIPSTAAVTIPTVNSGTYNGVITFGDGSGDKIFTAYNDADFTHSFPSAGNYTIAITGSFPNIYFNNTTYKTYLKSIDNLGEVWTPGLAVYRGFWGCANLTNVSVTNITSDLSAWTRGDHGFESCTSLKEVDFSSMQWPDLTVALDMFRGCTALTTLRLPTNMSSVTDMSSMFNGCTALTTLGLPTNMSSVTDMSSMFNGCTKLITNNLDQIDIGTGLTTLASTWFNNQQLREMDLSGWGNGVSNVTLMSYTFENCMSLQTLDLSNWKLYKCTTFYKLCEYPGGNNTLTNVNLAGMEIPALESMAYAWQACRGLKHMQLLDIPATMTSAFRTYWDCGVLTGNVADIQNASTTLANWGTYNSDLTYTYTNGFLSSNVMDGFSLEFIYTYLPAQQTANILVDLDTSGASNIVATLGANTSPTPDGYQAYTNLLAKGGTISLP